MLILLALATAHADTTIYGNVAGGLGFTLHNIGDFALGVEQVFGDHHGVLAEGTVIHVHGNPTHATTYGVQVGYRYHGAPVDAPFVGVVVGYEPGFAKFDKAEHGGPYWRYDLVHTSVVPHVGYRWGIGERFAVTARVGGGYGAWSIASDESVPAENAQILRDRLQFSPIKLDTELSFGVRF